VLRRVGFHELRRGTHVQKFDRRRALMRCGGRFTPSHVAPHPAVNRQQPQATQCAAIAWHIALAHEFMSSIVPECMQNTYIQNKTSLTCLRCCCIHDRCLHKESGVASLKEKHHRTFPVLWSARLTLGPAPPALIDYQSSPIHHTLLLKHFPKASSVPAFCSSSPVCHGNCNHRQILFRSSPPEVSAKST